MEKIAKNINNDNFAEMIDLERFKEVWFTIKSKNGKEKFISEFELIESNSGLRKIFDSYLEIYDKSDYEIEKQIWIAKIAYQEKRWLLPTNKKYKKLNNKYVLASFTEFIKELDRNLNKENFKRFLEILVAYHKYFNPDAK